MAKRIIKSQTKKPLALNTLLLGVCATAFLTHQNALGAENSIEYGLTGEATYNDNRYLNAINKQDVYIFRINPSVGLLIEDEGSRTLITATGSYALSSDQLVQEDRFTYGGSLVGDYQFEYSSLNIGAGYNHETVFETEFEDTGIFSNDITRDRGYASFEYRANLSESWNVRFSDSFQIMEYSAVDFFNNYWSNIAGLGLDVDLNATTSFVQDVSYLRYEPQNQLVRPLNSYSYLAGLRHELSENTTVTITGGATYLEKTYRWSAIAEITHELENSQFSLRAAREMTPSGLGGIRQSESVVFNTTYNYSEGTDMGVTASWRRSKDLTNIIQLNNEFIGVSPWISFEVIRDLHLRLRYQLRRQRIGFTNDWGISNSFFISIEY